ncbi:MAG: class I SAM-dependent methyltransferase [Candidatus Pacebacteria bacterium]|nr:class I SAM-dependent methyltransferase [Candidatus Paceibacterota bacterium]
MDQNKEKEQKFWDDCAKKRVYAAFDKDEYDDIFNKAIGDFRGKKIIDIGCASGVSAALLATKGASVVGMDISPELINQAKDLWKNSGLDLSFETGDAENLNHKDGSMDVCFFGGVIHHFPDKNKVIRECGRVLRPGGILLAIEPNRNDFFQRLNWKIARKRNLLTPNEDLVRPQEVSDLMEKYGLKNIKITTFREHLSFLGLLFPWARKCFAEHGKTTFAEKIALFPVDLFRKNKLNKGNFLVIYGERA